VPIEYPPPPPLDEFGEFRLHNGKVWKPDPEWDTRDDSCVAVAHGPDGWVAIADTKHPETPPLCFTAIEWDRFTHAVRDDRI